MTEEQWIWRFRVPAWSLLVWMFGVVCGLAFAARAQPRSADLLYLPVVTHTGGWKTDVHLTNTSDDSVTVSAWFTPANTHEDERRMADTPLGPHERKMIEVAELGVSGTGQLIFEACKKGESCTPVLFVGTFANLTRFTLFNSPLPLRNRRDISAEVRVYSTGTNSLGQIGTRGDSYLAVPWWATVGPTDGPVDFPWIKVDAQHGTTIGVNNTSGYSTITVTSILFDGLGRVRGQAPAETLCPLCSVRRSAESMFPVLATTNRENRLPTDFGWWVRVEQIDSTPNELAAKEKDIADAESCFGGCAQFVAYANVTDNSMVASPCPAKQFCNPDIYFITPEFERTDRSRTGAPAEQTASVRAAAIALHPTARIDDVLRFTFTGPTCSIEPGPMRGDYLLRLPNGAPWTHVGIGDLVRAREMCGAARTAARTGAAE